MTPRTPVFELVAQDINAVKIAAEIGAARVELCQGLALGGLTPSAGLVEEAVAAARGTQVEVHALIRPRAGGFVYSAEEVDLIERDVRAAFAAGAHGVVVGCLTNSGVFDMDAMARLVTAAEGRSVAAHRAIDLTRDPVAAVDQLIELGVVRALTSGGASKAIDGADTLAAMVERASGRLEIMAGSGVNTSNVVALWETGVDAVHFSAKRDVVDTGEVSMGSADAGGVGTYEVTDREAAFAITRALTGAGV